MTETRVKLLTEIKFLECEIKRVKALQAALTDAEYRKKINGNRTRLDEIDEVLAAPGDEELEEKCDLLDERTALVNESPEGLLRLQVEFEERKKALGI